MATLLRARRWRATLRLASVSMLTPLTLRRQRGRQSRSGQVGLGHKPPHARAVQSLNTEVAQAPRGSHDNVRRVWLLSEPARNLEPVEVWQLDIQQDRVRAQPLAGGHSVRSVAHLADHHETGG